MNPRVCDNRTADTWLVRNSWDPCSSNRGDRTLAQQAVMVTCQIPVGRTLNIKFIQQYCSFQYERELDKLGNSEQ